MKNAGMCICFSSRRKLLLRVVNWKQCFMLFPPFVILLISTLIILSFRPEILLLNTSVSSNETTTTKFFQLQLKVPFNSSLQFNNNCNRTSHFSFSSPPLSQIETKLSPYHNWELFDMDYQEMLQKLKIYIYPDVSTKNQSSPFASIFLPHPKPIDPKIGNYFSEHAFKLALLQSPLITQNPKEAHFFFMPFSINVMRNHPLVRSESSISDFVANYTLRISSNFQFWNASGGADHFFVCCHSVGREAASRHFALRNNAIQVTCSSSYFQRLYSAHKDIALPQIWPRQPDKVLNRPNERNKLVFFAGRVQNSNIRKELISLWENDTSFSIFSKHPPSAYEEGFRTSKYCLHVKGYEVNTARVSDAIHYGCIPVLISNHYDLPFANVLDWSKFSIIVSQSDIKHMKSILFSVNEQKYQRLFENLCMVRKHFTWHTRPRNYDAFYMTAYQLWLRRGLHRLLA